MRCNGVFQMKSIHRSFFASWLATCALAACAPTSPSYCGDGLCQIGEGEDRVNCAVDCMGDSCGDGICRADQGEACSNCPIDCGGCAGCGDGVCDALREDCSICPGDCGSCRTTCGPSTCAGCCSGDTCLGGDASNACGGGGDLCIDCGPDFVCNFGSCAVDGASRWTLVLDTVRFDPTDYSGAAWDPTSGPDPYIGVRVGGASSTPTYIDGPDDTLSITYTRANRVVDLRADALDAFLIFDVWEDDSFDDDSVCSFFASPATASWFAGTTQVSTCVADAAAGVSGMTLTWHLERY
ncbi:MAG: hypothetical protein ACK6CU_31195 [Deltaproteobacteria bacterium]|jgi:hypothetical protein